MAPQPHLQPHMAAVHQVVGIGGDMQDVVEERVDETVGGENGQSHGVDNDPAQEVGDRGEGLYQTAEPLAAHLCQEDGEGHGQPAGDDADAAQAQGVLDDAQDVGAGSVTLEQVGEPAEAHEVLRRQLAAGLVVEKGVPPTPQGQVGEHEGQRQDGQEHEENLILFQHLHFFFQLRPLAGYHLEESGQQDHRRQYGIQPEAGGEVGRNPVIRGCHDLGVSHENAAQTASHDNGAGERENQSLALHPGVAHGHAPTDGGKDDAQYQNDAGDHHQYKGAGLHPPSGQGPLKLAYQGVIGDTGREQGDVAVDSCGDSPRVEAGVENGRAGQEDGDPVDNVYRVRAGLCICLSQCRCWHVHPSNSLFVLLGSTPQQQAAYAACCVLNVFFALQKIS